MELTNPESIRGLLAAFGDPTRVRQPHAADAAKSARKGRRVVCRCGHCRQCLDDARWNRIFTEKFADPAYYTRSTIHRASPLTSI
jgi:hypothetical protein